MSRCRSCDKLLSNFEATRKIITSDGTVEYPDLCNKDFNLSGLREVTTVIERNDLRHEEDINEENQVPYE